MNKNNEDKWVFDLCGAETWGLGEGEYNTKEEAIQAGKEFFKYIRERWGDYKDETHFSVGQIKSYTPHVCVDSIIEHIAEDAYSEVGEIAEDYLYDIPRQQCDELEEMINQVVLSWMERTNNLPKFYMIENVEDVEL